VDRAFYTSSVHGVGAGAFALNDASRAVLESLGFTEEYRHREAEYVDGEHRDFVNYGLLRREWES
jgi:RimJ/RimL family protein N-acetyltransferase